MEKSNNNGRQRIVVCLHDKDKKRPLTLNSPNEEYLKEVNDKGYGIFETANSFFATDEQVKLSGNKTKRQKEFLTKLNEVYADLDVCKDTDGMAVIEREERKEKLMNALDLWCPPSVYVITKNGLQPRWWIDEKNVDEATQHTYVNVINGIIEWSKMLGSLGDPVKDVTRILRKPGYYHHKSDPYLITEKEGCGKTYTLKELKEYFWFEGDNKVSESKQTISKSIDLLDIKTVVVDVWKEKGSIAEFDKDNHLFVNGVKTATFKGRLGNGNFIATSSSNYPAKGNAVTYVAETLGISTKEAWKWLCEKYPDTLLKSSLTKSEVSKNCTTSKSSISFSELLNTTFTPARYTIEPFFEQGTMNMVSAPPNTWKSWLLFLFARHIAEGTAVFDEFETVKASVMIVNEEDSARLIQDRFMKLDITDQSLQIFFRVAQGSKLTTEFVDELIAEAREKNVEVIMFDSLRAIHEADENDSTAMQGVMDLLKKIARENITVIFTHHHRKKGMFAKNDDSESSRGSSAINAAISGHISLTETNGPDNSKILVLKHLKSKVGEKLEPIDIEIKVGEKISFYYTGKHEGKNQAENEAKNRIIEVLKEQTVLLSRKDFVNLKIAGNTTIKNALKALEVTGEVKFITRKEADLKELPTLSTGKVNEKLYSLISDGAMETTNSLVDDW